MKKLWLPFIGLIVFLTACSAGFDQKTQLKQTSNNIVTQVAKQNAAIDTIQNQIGAFPSTFETAYAAHPNADFQNTGKIHALIQKREAAYKQLERVQSQLEAATNQLVKINSQANAQLPKTQLKKTIATLKLAQLDHKTFDAYYKELTDAEQDFFDTVAADPSDKSGIEDALGQLNQYDSSLGQQADIVEANLQSVTADAQSLHAAAVKMK
ncbi:hypothetical protein [Lacticaseibacillus sp. N501-2]|uniref:hypothetical protein n=1 Tax=Lacticaseibacillus salsurae TaxID=3367729 RepID=UPI0038B35489